MHPDIARRPKIQAAEHGVAMGGLHSNNLSLGHPTVTLRDNGVEEKARVGG